MNMVRQQLQSPRGIVADVFRVDVRSDMSHDSAGCSIVLAIVDDGSEGMAQSVEGLAINPVFGDCPKLLADQVLAMQGGTSVFLLNECLASLGDEHRASPTIADDALDTLRCFAPQGHRAPFSGFATRVVDQLPVEIDTLNTKIAAIRVSEPPIDAEQNTSIQSRGCGGQNDPDLLRGVDAGLSFGLCFANRSLGRCLEVGSETKRSINILVVVAPITPSPNRSDDCRCPGGGVSPYNVVTVRLPLHWTDRLDHARFAESLNAFSDQLSIVAPSLDREIASIDRLALGVQEQLQQFEQRVFIFFWFFGLSTCFELFALVVVATDRRFVVAPHPKVVQLAPDLLRPLAVHMGEQRGAFGLLWAVSLLNHARLYIRDFQKQGVAHGVASAFEGAPKGGEKSRKSLYIKRRERDSNPRYSCLYTRFPVVRLQPLGHLSRGLQFRVWFTP